MPTNVFDTMIQKALEQAISDFKRGVEPPKYPRTGREALIDQILREEDERERELTEAKEKGEVTAPKEDLTKVAAAAAEVMKDKLITATQPTQSSHTERLQQSREKAKEMERQNNGRS